jgi:ABC-type transporter Mla subunit MlaD
MINDRLIGYVVLVALLAFAAVCIGTVAWVFFSPRETRVIMFDNAGTLKIDDPVRISGKDVGKISRIDLNHRTNRPLITIQLFKRIAIRDDYAIAMVDLGLMGDRAITLDCGSVGRPELPLNDTLTGTFIMGPSEAIGLMYKLRETVVGFVQVSDLLMRGDARHASLIRQISRATTYIDSVSALLVGFAGSFDRNLTGELDSLAGLVKEASGLSRSMAQTLPATLASADTISRQLSGALASVDTLLAAIRPVAAKLRGPEAQKFQDQIATLIKQVGEIKGMLDDLEARGVPLKVRFF